MRQANPGPLFVVLSLLAAGLALPTTQGAGAAFPTLEALGNGDLEGGSGFELLYEGAQTTPVAQHGAQAVDLAKAGASPQSWFALGAVRVPVAAPATLGGVAGVSYQYSFPRAAAASISLVEILGLDTNGDGERDVCLYAGSGPLAATTGYTPRVLDDATTFTVAGADCGSGYAQSFGAIRAAYYDATVLALTVESVVGAPGAWPAGSPLDVDALSVAVAAIRVADAAHETCSAVGHATIAEALTCSSDGATVLVGPGTYAGFAITHPATVCASAVGGAACETRTDVVVDGPASSLYVVTLQAADSTVRGFVIQNPNLNVADTATSPVDPSLVVVFGDRARVEGNTLQANGAQPGPLSSRWLSVGINVEAGANVVLADNKIGGLPSGRGLDGTCYHAPCGALGIYVANGLVAPELRNNLVDLRAAPWATAITLDSDGAILRDNNVILMPSTSQQPTRGIAYALGTASGVVFDTNTARAPSKGDVAPLGLVANLTNPYFANNTFIRMREAWVVNLTGYAYMERNIFGENGVGLRINGGTVHFQDGTVAQSSPAMDFDNLQGLELQNVLFNDNRGGVNLRFGPGTHDLRVPAQGNDWYAYSKSEIAAKIVDLGTNNVVDFSCYRNQDSDVPVVCPPTASFVTANDTWRRPVDVYDGSASGGRPIATREWDFGDGATASGTSARHVYDAPGAYTVRLTVTDTEGWTSTLARTLVIRNGAPVLAPIGNRTLAENESIALRLAASDPENDALAMSATGLPPGATFDAATGRFAWTPTYAQEGAYGPTTFAVTDGWYTDSETVFFTVGHANAPPTLAIQGALSGPENAPLALDVATSDLDGDAVSLFAAPLPSGASWTLGPNGTGRFAWTPTYFQSGDYNLTLQASDGANVTTNVVRLHVTNLDRAPAFDPVPVTQGRETDPLEVAVYASDPDGELVDVVAKKLPPGASFDRDARVMRWTPTYLQAGTWNATFAASDGNLTTLVNATIVVANVDRAPTLAPLADASVLAGRTLRVPLVVTDPDTNDAFTFRAPGAPSGVTFEPGALVWRTAPAQAGNWTFPVVASDGTLESWQNLTVQVGPNAAPVVALAGANRTDALLNAPFSAYGSVDPDGDSARLAYAWDFDDRDGFQAQRSGVNASWAFTNVGTYNVTVRVTDQDGVVTTRTIPHVVDDLLRLSASVFTSTKTQGYVFASLRDEPYGAVGGAPIHAAFYYEGLGGGPRVALGESRVVTRADGTALIPLPYDALVASLPGRHVVTLDAKLATSYLGDEETAITEAAWGDVAPFALP